MFADNPLFKKMLETGEEQFSRLVTQIISNEKFAAALQTAVSKAIEAKGAFDRQLSNAVSAMHVPTTEDMKKVTDRLEELERIFDGLSQKIDAIASRLDQQKK